MKLTTSNLVPTYDSIAHKGEEIDLDFKKKDSITIEKDE